MEYELIYDAARDFAGWQIIAGWVALFGFLITLIYFTERIPRIILFLFLRNWGENDTDWGRTIIAVSVLILGAGSMAIIKENLELRSISKKNDCTQIAGVVMDFKSQFTNVKRSQITGHKESFTLNDIEFKYDTDFLNMGFNTAAADGGPIYEGAKVRLCYLERWDDREKERKIIRVETASNSIE